MRKILDKCQWSWLIRLMNWQSVFCIILFSLVSARIPDYTLLSVSSCYFSRQCFERRKHVLERKKDLGDNWNTSQLLPGFRQWLWLLYLFMIIKSTRLSACRADWKTWMPGVELLWFKREENPKSRWKAKKCSIFVVLKSLTEFGFTLWNPFESQQLIRLYRFSLVGLSSVLV